MADEYKDDIKQQIGQMIQDARKAKGLSQSELAALLGTTQVVISRYEAGTQNITIDTIKKIVKALQTEITITFKV